jgi:hypothetical protein
MNMSNCWCDSYISKIKLNGVKAFRLKCGELGVSNVVWTPSPWETIDWKAVNVLTNGTVSFI